VKESKEARAERQARDEWQLVDVLRRAGNKLEPEANVTPERKWRVDYLINGEIALEVQGIGFGHHSFGAIMKTYEKNNAIAAQGWRLVQVTRAQVANGEALEALARCGVRVEPPRTVHPCPHCTASGAGPGKTLCALCNVCEGTGVACPHASGQTTEGNCAKCGGKA